MASAGQGIVPPVISAHVVAILAVAARAAKLLNPAVLVRRHCLCRQLAANPVRFLRQDDAVAQAGRRHRRRHATGAAADDQDIG